MDLKIPSEFIFVLLGSVASTAHSRADVVVRPVEKNWMLSALSLSETIHNLEVEYWEMLSLYEVLSYTREKYPQLID